MSLIFIAAKEDVRLQEKYDHLNHSYIVASKCSVKVLLMQSLYRVIPQIR